MLKPRQKAARLSSFGRCETANELEELMHALSRAITEIVARFDGSRAAAFLARVEAGELTRDENPESHFCVYFAAYSRTDSEVFMGHHKKSGLWLFNGGHIDRSELPLEAVEREIGEEWGIAVPHDAIGDPQLLTVTMINNLTGQTCTCHYDLWYFIFHAPGIKPSPLGE